ncbi:hypothetical protein BN2476_720019 [Paraburkholderia piptadeniae]|uniref:Uncharacterized protein n=1 Tax=Paraburkholderia piptadeniae TaxID=1701573 RepID=A0A1N7SQT3_9BURK|nr:hypothetical protein BN2476_720019 [Paraburkholderia piptadeniae]
MFGGYVAHLSRFIARKAAKPLCAEGTRPPLAEDARGDLTIFRPVRRSEFPNDDRS